MNPALAICAIIRDEALYLEEWVAFHMIMGVSAFCIYDNGSTDFNRPQDHLEIEFTFLGYTFRPRKALDKYGRVYVNFSPAVSGVACKSMRPSEDGICN
jgi:hypothetical protein